MPLVDCAPKHPKEFQTQLIRTHKHENQTKREELKQNYTSHHTNIFVETWQTKIYHIIYNALYPIWVKDYAFICIIDDT